MTARIALVLVVSVGCQAWVAGATFVHRRTGERLEGELLGRATTDGAACLVAKIDGAIRRLPAISWEVADAGEPRPKPRKRPFRWPEIVYQGKKRSREWLERVYADQAESIIVCLGNYANLRRLRATQLRDRHVSVGDIVAGTGRVSRILGPGRMLAVLDNFQEVVVTAVDTAGWTDGKRFNAVLVGVETCHPWPGATLLRCQVAPPAEGKASREEFAAALRAGVLLAPVYVWRPCGTCSGLGYVNVRKWRRSGAQRVSYTAKKRCPRCGGRKGQRVDITR